MATLQTNMQVGSLTVVPSRSVGMQVLCLGGHHCTSETKTDNWQNPGFNFCCPMKGDPSTFNKSPEIQWQASHIIIAFHQTSFGKRGETLSPETMSFYENETGAGEDKEKAGLLFPAINWVFISWNSNWKCRHQCLSSMETSITMFPNICGQYYGFYIQPLLEIRFWQANFCRLL